MGQQLIYSYCTYRSKDEEIEIDKLVSANRRKVYIFVRTLPSNSKDKSKRLMVALVLVATLWFSNIQPSQAMGLSITPPVIVRVQRRYESYHHTLKLRTPEMVLKENRLIASISNREILFLMAATDPRISSNQEILKILNRFRGGNLNMVIIAIGIVLILIVQAQGFGINQAFGINQGNQGWGLPHGHQNHFQPTSAVHKHPAIRNGFDFRPRRSPGSPGSALTAVKPKFYTHQEFAALSPKDKHEAKHPNDMKFIYNGERECLQLRIPYNQAEYKVTKHGMLHGVEVTKNSKNETICKRSEENTLLMVLGSSIRRFELLR